jgi:hypothetical protein
MEMGTASGEARLSAGVPRGKGVTTADKYRRRAQACLIAASSASTEEGRAGLIELAKTWLRLAQEQEQGSTNIDFVPLIAGKDRPVVQQQQQVQPVAGAAPMANDDDPPAPYKLYDGDERIGTYRTRAEARRAQQKLESEAGSERRLFTIKDNLDRIVL